MYITKFIRKDGKADEKYEYETEKEAFDHLKLFENDDSNLYKNISVLDVGRNVIMRFISFDENGKSRGILSNGDLVAVRKKWCKPGEEKYLYFVQDMNEQSGRGLITCVNSFLPIAPAEYVDLERIEHIT